jgi:phospholipid-binding lipoprotein MlaA
MNSLRAAAILLLALGGCVSARQERFEAAARMEKPAADRFESLNRKVYAVNDAVDTYAARPVAVAYVKLVPEAPRRAVSGFFSNAEEPLNVGHAVLQGKVKSAFRGLDRLLINLFLGAGGLADHATAMGLDEEPHDAGQTMAVWGIGPGPYVMLPFFGPSTLRDGIGFVIDFAVDPYRYIQRQTVPVSTRTQLLALEVTDLRARLLTQGEQLLTGSADEYATLRSAYLQSRRAELYDGDPPLDEEDYLDADLDLPVEDSATDPVPPDRR